jgi:hypothetical protein
MPEHPPGASPGTITLAERLAARGVKVQIAIPEKPPGGKKGYDWNDALIDGADPAKLREAILGAPEFKSSNPFATIPLTVQEWLDRTLDAPDPICGHMLSTTTRALLNAATGIGKTNFGLAIAGHIGAGHDFLHWSIPRPRHVLYVDGEMSRRLFRQYLEDMVRRLGCVPPCLYPFSREDIDGFAPLNTREGQDAMWKLIEEAQRRSGQKLDAVVFDNIMSLIVGDMKEEDAWRDTLPLVTELTRREIGQLWEHHTGHDTSRGYGTKTREWRMDTVMHLDKVEHEDAYIAFSLSFPKARERTPTNRDDFAETEIALVNDRWEETLVVDTAKAQVSPMGRKFFEALQAAAGKSKIRHVGDLPAASLEEWRVECIERGLIDVSDKPNRVRALTSKYRCELIAANWIATNTEIAWILP